MSCRQGSYGLAPRAALRGLTLLEVLVVISIIALLLSILLPTLSRAKEEARTIYCMSNMREIGGAVCSYMPEYDNLPWTYLQGDDQTYPDTKYYTSYSWGGTKACRPLPGTEKYDCALVPTELRPLNRYIDPSAIGADGIKIVRCPSDRSAVSPDVNDQANDSVEIEGPRSSWEAYGSSYSINWLFMEDPAIPDPSDFIASLMTHGKEFVQEAVGASATEMVVMWENQADQLLAHSSDIGGGRLGEGWHRKFSHHSFLFMDGHMEHGFFDTRFCRGVGWRLWRK